MKNTLYGIGLDIGVASVGWAVVGLNDTGEPVGLHRLGVRIFDKAEQPKTGESLAAPRRMARGMRRRLRRKALRRADVYALLERSGLSTREALAHMFEAGGCCFSKRMRKVFRKNEKSMLQNCNKKAKRKGRLQRVKKPM